MTDRTHRGWTVVAVALTLVTAVVVLWPDGAVVNRGVVRLYVFLLERGVPASVSPASYARALNVLAFVPLGWLSVAVLRRRVAVAALALLALSAAVEAVQSLPDVARQPSVLDVVLNASGGLLGALLGAATARRRSRVDAGGHDSPG